MALRLLAVHAHPDDESSKGAATYAKYVQAGAEVLIVTCTGGERGDILNAAVAADPAATRDLTAVRRQEMHDARAIIGYKHLWLGYEDSGLPAEGEAVSELSFAGIDPLLPAAALIRVVRDFRPHVLIGYNEQGGYPHPDHIRAHEIAKIAWEKAGDPQFMPELGQPWEIKKFYYDAIFNSQRFAALYEAAAAGTDSELAERLEAILQRFSGAKPEIAELSGGVPYAEVTARVPVAEFLEVRDAALRAHASQVTPDNGFFFISNSLQRDAWASEDYRLAAARIACAAEETDLFAGIVEEQ